MTDIPKEIKEAYIEGWIDRDYSSSDDVGLVSVAIEKDWVKSNSSVSIISIERKWEWRYEAQDSKIKKLEQDVLNLKTRARELKKLQLGIKNDD
tara:strand:- start:494 stop:775 length:282 start_codon:yes stop_codon:yes gene_type:complete